MYTCKNVGLVEGCQTVHLKTNEHYHYPGYIHQLPDSLKFYQILRKDRKKNVVSSPLGV